MRLKETRLIVIATAMLCIFVQPALAASAISIEPAYIDVWQDDEFTMNIVVDPAENEVYGASYTLHFNNTLPMATSWTPGEFLTRDGNSSNVWIHEIDNTIGKFKYAEGRTGTDVGVGGDPGNLTMITFDVIGEKGISSLNISDLDGELLCSTSGSIPTTVYNGRVGIAQTQSPFLISGYISYENSSECNDPAVTITNMDVGEGWVAKTNETSNYYQIMLASCDDVIAGETLRFTATSPDGSQWNVTEHTVTLDEVNDGGLKFNITLEIHDVFIRSDYTGAHNTGIRIDNTTTEKILLDQYLTISDTYYIKYKVENNGTVDTETVDITVMISNATGWNKELANYPKDITSYHLGNVSWDTTGLATGNYNITVNASIPMDCNPEDNERTREVTLGTAEPDTTPPIITNIANTTPTTDSVTITWTTDEASDSLVKYGTTSSTYTNDESGAAMVTSHSITLTGLSPDTPYYFVVNSTDASDDSNESEEHSFTTAAVGPPELISCVITPTPPVVQGTNVSIDCFFSEGVNYEIRIENTTGALTETIGSGTATNPDPKWWNTTTGTPAGTYTVNVTMDNSTSGLSSYNDTNTIEVTDASDTTAPTITDNSPAGTDVPVTTDVTVTFDEAMNKTSAEGAFSITPDTAGAFSWSGDTVTLTPDADLTYDITYNVTIGTDAKDLAGNPLAESFEWNFTTTSAPDYQPSLVNYTISNTTISPNGDGIMDDTEIDVEFSEPVDATILIENATGVVKSLYTSSSKVTDPTPKTWDGTDDGDNIVADGTYHVNVTMDDGVNPLVYNNTRSIVVANNNVATISIGNVSGNMIAPIIIEDGTNVGACDINITYNASVVNVTNVTGGDFDAIATNLEHAHEGRVRIGVYQTSNPGLNGNFVLANVIFRSNSTNGTSSLNMSVTTFKDATPQCNEIPYIVQNGTYIAAMNGDVNGDGVVDIADAMYLAKHVLGKSGFEEIIVGAADVDGSGVVDIADAMYLAKHILGKSGFEELR
ncbi:MAG: Ig-like domain-containing protein [Candidatus Aerophobetes bacterium]|nr:Ig-like domain-containing protein [Candidatus Aerophobetes bacterium]